jgi:hypothetical protein
VRDRIYSHILGTIGDVCIDSEEQDKDWGDPYGPYHPSARRNKAPWYFEPSHMGIELTTEISQTFYEKACFVVSNPCADLRSLIYFGVFENSPIKMPCDFIWHLKITLSLGGDPTDEPVEPTARELDAMKGTFDGQI